MNGASWSLVAFDEAIEDATGGHPKTPQSDYLPNGLYPIIDQGRDLIGGYTNEASALSAVGLPVLVFGDHTRCLKFVDFPFGAGADGVKVLRPRDGFHPRFLFHYLRTVSLPGAGYARHFKYLREVQIPRPPMEEQHRIVDVLDSIDEIIAMRKKSLARLEELADAVFVRMFGSRRGNLRSTSGLHIDRVPLSDIAEIVAGGRQKLTGRDFVETGYPAFGAGGLNGFLPSPEFDRPGIVLSSVGARCGKCFLAEGQWASLANTQVILPNTEQVDPVFLWFQLNDEQRWPRSGTAQPFIKPSDVKSHLIYLPAIADQNQFAQRIAAIDCMRRRADACHERLQALRSALEQQAFRGEL